MRLLSPLVDWVESSPLEHIQWLPGQHAWLSDPGRRKLFRAGNQAQGKTWAGCSELIWRCLGRHPFHDTRPPPVHWWAVSSSEKQSGVLQQKFWTLAPRNQLDSRTYYDESKGAFVGKYPLARFRNGSIVEFRWTGSRSLNLAGASLDGVWFDEPPSRQRAFTEVERRLTRTGGDLLATLTPVNAPTDYLKALCDAGKVADHWYPLRPEYLIPVGCRSPICDGAGHPMDAAWIEEQRALVPAWEVPVVIDGEWEFRLVGSVFAGAWDPQRMVKRPAFPSYPVKLALGTDYGGETLRQVSILIAVDDSGDWPVVWVLDEYVADGPTTTEEDAAAVLEMLRRNGLSWADLDYAHGDKKWSGRKGDLTAKANEDFQRAVEDRLKLKRHALKPAMRNVKKGPDAGSGSRERGVRYVHQCMVRRDACHFFVHPRCEVLIRALGRWDWTEEMKDPVDALRYALRPWILGVRARMTPSTVRISR